MLHYLLDYRKWKETRSTDDFLDHIEEMDKHIKELKEAYQKAKEDYNKNEGKVSSPVYIDVDKLRKMAIKTRQIVEEDLKKIRQKN